MFDKDRTTQAAKDYILGHRKGWPSKSEEDDVSIFLAGAEYAQQHIEDVCVGFAIFCDHNDEEGRTYFKSLFREYIKQTSL